MPNRKRPLSGPTIVLALCALIAMLVLAKVSLSPAPHIPEASDGISVVVAGGGMERPQPLDARRASIATGAQETPIVRIPPPDARNAAK